jgi:hypothetical protein
MCLPATTKSAVNHGPFPINSLIKRLHPVKPINFDPVYQLVKNNNGATSPAHVVSNLKSNQKTKQMKAKHVLALIFSASLLFTACKKDNSAVKDENETEFTQQSDDQAKFTSDVDAVADDLNGVIETNNTLLGRGESTLCNANVVVDSISNPRTITITYNGADCSGLRTRTGTVTASIPSTTRFKDPGAVLTVTITNLKITRVSDGRFITINGSHTITNVTGGRLRDLAPGLAIIHTISSSNMNITFDNGTQRAWSVAKKRTFTYNGGVIIATTGNHTIGANNKVAEWGTNRFGNAFITSIEQPLVVKQTCNFRLTGGEVRHELLGRNLTVTFGLDAAGAPTGCPGANPYYMKLVWTGPAGQTLTVIRPY